MSATAINWNLGMMGFPGRPRIGLKTEGQLRGPVSKPANIAASIGRRAPTSGSQRNGGSAKSRSAV